MQSQFVEEHSVPKWIFLGLAGILWSLLCWIGIQTYNKTTATNDIIVRLAVKFDGQERQVDKLEVDVDALKTKVQRNDYRLDVVESVRGIRR